MGVLLFFCHAATTDLIMKNNARFGSIEAEGLAQVGGVLQLDSNQQFFAFGFPVLERIGGPLQIQNNAQLASASFPNTKEVGGKFVTDNENLRNINMDILRVIHGDFYVANSRSLGTITFFAK